MDQDLTLEFTIEELVAAMKTLHLDDSCLEWLTKLFSTCMEHKKMLKSWKMAKIIAVLKPKNPADSPKTYRPISLLNATYKLLERLIYSRILPIVESILLEEQAGFRPNRGTLDQVALLTENIESAFSKNMKAGTFLVDLSAAYDTVWHRGLTLKLLQIIPSKDIVRMIMCDSEQASVRIDPDIEHLSMGYLRALSFHRYFLTFTPMTFLNLYVRTTYMQMISHCYTVTVTLR